MAVVSVARVRALEDSGLYGPPSRESEKFAELDQFYGNSGQRRYSPNIRS